MNNYQCMVCKTESPTVPFETDHKLYLSNVIAVQYGWALSTSADCLFLCCDQCYPKAFDTSVGNVGRLKDEFKHLGERELL